MKNVVPPATAKPPKPKSYRPAKPSSAPPAVGQQGGRWAPKPVPEPANKEMLDAMLRLVALTEDNRRANQKTAELAAAKSDILELGFIWSFIVLVIAYVGMMVGMNAIAESPAGRFFGLRTMGSGGQAEQMQGGQFASPIVGRSLGELVAYVPSPGQSFGPKTGNQRSYGPHGGVDFDCRVGGCAGAAVASPIDGMVSQIRKIGVSANGGSYQVHITGTDWAGAVEHQLVHVDSITVNIGDRVKAGQVVAKVSPTDSVSTGPHLDWKIRRNGQWEDPQEWSRKSASQSSGPSRSGSPSDELLKRAIGRAEGTRDRAGNPTAAFAGHKDPGWSGRCKNQGSFSYQHCASSPEEADRRWLVVLRRAEQTMQAQAQARFGRPLSTFAVVAGLDAYTQSPDAGGKRFVKHLASANPSVEQVTAARTAALAESRQVLGGPPLNVAADQQRRVAAIAEQMSL